MLVNAVRSAEFKLKFLALALFQSKSRDKIKGQAFLHQLEFSITLKKKKKIKQGKKRTSKCPFCLQCACLPGGNWKVRKFQIRLNCTKILK